MVADERLELGHELCAVPGGQLGFDATLDRRQPQLLQPCDLGLEEWLVDEIRVGRTSPEGERRAQTLGGGLSPAGCEQPAALGKQRFEAIEIENHAVARERVSPVARRENTLPER